MRVIVAGHDLVRPGKHAECLRSVVLLLVHVAHGEQILVILGRIRILADGLQQRQRALCVSQRQIGIREPKIDSLLVRALRLRPLEIFLA